LGRRIYGFAVRGIAIKLHRPFVGSRLATPTVLTRRDPIRGSSCACYDFPVFEGDTTRAAKALQLEIQRSMSEEQRLLLAFEMSLFARELCRAGIRQKHPDWSEAQLDRELLRLAFFPAPLPDLR